MEDERREDAGVLCTESEKGIEGNIMNVEIARVGVFMIFLLAAAWQDFGTKQVSAVVFLLSAFAALVCQSVSALCLVFAEDAGGTKQVLLFWLSAWRPYLAGMLPGAVLLGLSRLGVGIGAEIGRAHV